MQHIYFASGSNGHFQWLDSEFRHDPEAEFVPCSGDCVFQQQYLLHLWRSSWAKLQEGRYHSEEKKRGSEHIQGMEKHAKQR